MYITIINNYEHGLKVNRMVTKRKGIASHIVSNATENQRLHLLATRMILQESKDCIKKSIDEAIMEISPYMDAIMGYHDQGYQNTKEIVDNSLEILYDAVISFQSALDPYLRTDMGSSNI
jgi:hypothetical protein